MKTVIGPSRVPEVWSELRSHVLAAEVTEIFRIKVIQGEEH